MMNEREAWLWIGHAITVREPNDRLNGICHYIGQLSHACAISHDTSYHMMCKIDNELPWSKRDEYGYAWPLNSTGDAMRVKFCLKQADEQEQVRSL